MRKVTREELIKMIENDEDYSQVDVSEITNFSFIFHDKIVSFDISNWNTSSAIVMKSMFENARCSFSLENWDVSNVKNMKTMFCKSNYNHPLNDWDVSNTENMENMFTLSKYNCPLNKWDVSNVKNMMAMFYESNYNHSLKNWKINKKCELHYIFQGANLKDYPKNIDIKALFQASSFYLQSEDENKMKINVKNSYMLENQLLELNFAETEAFSNNNIDYDKPIYLIEIEHKEDACNPKQLYFMKQNNYFTRIHRDITKIILEDCLAV